MAKFCGKVRNVLRSTLENRDKQERQAAFLQWAVWC